MSFPRGAAIPAARGAAARVCEALSTTAFEDAVRWVMAAFPGARLVTLDMVGSDEVPPAAVSGKQPGTAADAPPP